MKYLSSVILIISLFSLWGCSDAGDIVSCTGELDCAGTCGGDAVIDDCGACNGNSSTCNISYSTTVQYIFDNHCTSCHGSSGGLSLSSYEDLMNGGVVIPESGSESLLIQKLRGTASGSRMPASDCCLDESIIQLIETWINEGAQNN